MTPIRPAQSTLVSGPAGVTSGGESCPAPPGGTDATEIPWFRDDPDPEAGPTCLAVMYHYVGEPAPALSQGVKGLSTAAFEAQIEQLCRVAEPVGWPAVSAWLRGDGDLPRRAFLPTFDDGLADHARTAGPVLSRHGVSGLFFVPGAVLESDAMLPAHQIHLLLARLSLVELQTALSRALRSGAAPAAASLVSPGASQAARDPQIPGPHPAGDGAPIHWLSRSEAAAAETMYHYESPPRAHLKYLLTAKLPIAVRNRVLTEMFERHVGSNAAWRRRWYLSRQDVKMLHADGHVIGGHGFSHEPVRRLTPTRRDEDLRRSADVLGGVLGTAVDVMSYPYGSVDPDVVESARRAGFRAAFSTRAATIRDSDEPLALPRVDTIAVQVRSPGCETGTDLGINGDLSDVPKRLGCGIR